MTHAHLITDPADALTFAFGGNARFTLVSQKTNNRKTYRLKEKADRFGSVFFAQLLTGPDNTADYTYLGYVKQRHEGLIAGGKGNPNHPAFVALDWVLTKLAAGAMPEQLEFWHEGRCAKCARVLTDPVSIERGLGPECANKE
tara:strand:- start:342 stop:770 length:429 start_codon:yes stop_codon:yes gene_type:complete